VPSNRKPQLPAASAQGHTTQSAMPLALVQPSETLVATSNSWIIALREPFFTSLRLCLATIPTQEAQLFCDSGQRFLKTIEVQRVLAQLAQHVASGVSC
jgi:hypothetical protein